MRIAILFFFFSIVGTDAKASPALNALVDWLALERDERPPLKSAAYAKLTLNRGEAQKAREMLWKDHATWIKSTRSAEFEGKKLKIGDKEMPYLVRTFGDKPESGRSLYISMHGGGGAPARVNDQQWQNQIKLYQPEEGIYLAPRAPENTWDLWHKAYIDNFFDRLIENLIVFEDVNPNKVYLMGYSAGGDGVYRLAPRMADRFAAAAMMAGHPGGTKALSLRNLPFTLHVGGNDRAYKRNEKVPQWDEKLNELQAADPGGYIHEAKVHEGKPHWMDLEDKVAVPWMAKFERRRFPDRVVWKQDHVKHPRFYWLGIPEAVTKNKQLAIVKRDGQTFTIEKVEDVSKLTIFVNDEMVDMDQEVVVKMAGKELYRGIVKRSLAAIYNTMIERGDPGAVFSGAVTLSLDEQIEAAGVAADRPNILFIMIDDMGWMDLRIQGNKSVQTPNIDRLAGEGMRFTDAYAASPVCTPTRAAIMTGLAPARLHITNHTPDQKRFTPENSKLRPAPMYQHLKADYRTLAEELKEAGYSTAFMGKWHLSGREKDQATREPQAQGFDINIGGCNFGGPPTFFDPYKIPNLEPRKEGEYLPERLADEAIDYIKKDRGEKPFFLCLWNYTIHWPMEAPEALLKKYADHKGPGLNDSRYGAMIEGMDLAIGRVLKAVDDLKLRDDTLVIFTSDNGGFGGVADNRPLRADKGHLYEGGVRIPLIVRWPGMVEAGVTNATPVISMDWFPTLLEVGGAPAPKLTDGESLLPILRGTGELKRDAIYIHYPNYAFHKANRLGSSIRMGKHKLIEHLDDNSFELFDLKADLSEQMNLAEKQPQLAEKMVQKLRAWRRLVDANMPTQAE